MKENSVFTYSLKEHGGTALGPALLLSSALASQIPGSQVTVAILTLYWDDEINRIIQAYGRYVLRNRMAKECNVKIVGWEWFMSPFLCLLYCIQFLYHVYLFIYTLLLRFLQKHSTC